MTKSYNKRDFCFTKKGEEYTRFSIQFDPKNHAQKGIQTWLSQTTCLFFFWKKRKDFARKNFVPIKFCIAYFFEVLNLNFPLKSSDFFEKSERLIWFWV